MTTRSSVFNEKKNKLKAFSRNLPSEESLPSVPDSKGPFGWFDYKVTGSDFNTLTQSIQGKMIKQNQILVRTIKEFSTIYDTFSALDKEYIQGILISIKAAEEANAKALKGIEGVQENQNEIKQIIDQQKQVIQVLKNFKEKIEKIEHLTDVDEIFDAFSKMQFRVNDLSDGMKTLISSQSVFQVNLNDLREIQVKQFQSVNQLISNQNDSISKIEANNCNFDAKLDSTTNEITRNKINFENAIKELKVGIEQQEKSVSDYLKTELSGAKNQIKELSLLIGSLSKELKTTKVISLASIVITCVLVIFIISGVL